MCGTDYNTNIPKIGSINAYKLIFQHKTIENIEKNTKHNTEILKHVRGRELFTEFENYGLKEIPYCGQPDFEKLVNFTKNNNILIDIEKLRQYFIKDLVFLE